MLMSGALMLPAVLLAEWVWGYPRWLLARVGHPVMWMGALMGELDRRWNRGSPCRQRIMGAAMLALLVAASAGAAAMVQHALLQSLWLWPVLVLAATTGLAQRSLADHVEAVAVPLAAGDLETARMAVAMIVGRDIAGLDEAGIATAAIESLAESFGDGIVTPACWLALAGLPGLAAAKAINTADSMVGHRDARYRFFGWASARADDALNYLPARLSGALGRQLGGPVSYDGELAPRATMGDGPRADARDLARALVIWRRACGLWWALAAIVAGVILWLR